MTPASRNPLSDLRGAGRLAIDATRGITDLVEALHHTIGEARAPLGEPSAGRTRGVTGLVYRSVRGVTGLVGGGIDVVLRALLPLLADQGSSPTREAIVAALNGVLGDYLVESENPLAIALQFREAGEPLLPDKRSTLARSMQSATGKLVVLVHGLCCNDLQWTREGHDHGAALARDLGYTPVYLHYNSGLHVSTNGRALAEALETLRDAWPLPLREIAIVGHSMGGLVARAACHWGAGADHAWLRSLRHLVFLGTPHHGAPLERGGNWIDVVLDASPYTAPFARLGKLRSAGITDLRHGNLTDADWQGRDRFARGDHRRIVPLPKGVACYAIAATTDLGAGLVPDQMASDGLVPVASALGRHEDAALSLKFARSRQWIAQGCGHLDLMSRSAVYERMRRWLDVR